MPLSEQYPNLGTEQSVSAKTEFTTVWGSFELPGGPCGYASAKEHYNALLDDAKRRGGPTPGYYCELLNSDAGIYGGDDLVNAG